MELKKSYIGSSVYLKSIDRKVEVTEDNKKLLLQCKESEFLFTKPKKKKNVSNKHESSEHDSSNPEGEANA
jgi:hypothetical protein